MKRPMSNGADIGEARTLLDFCQFFFHQFLPFRNLVMIDSILKWNSSIWFLWTRRTKKWSELSLRDAGTASGSATTHFCHALQRGFAESWQPSCANLFGRTFGNRSKTPFLETGTLSRCGKILSLHLHCRQHHHSQLPRCWFCTCSNNETVHSFQNLF